MRQSEGTGERRHLSESSSSVSRWKRTTRNPLISNGFVVALLLIHLHHLLLPGIEGSVLFIQRSFVSSSQGLGRCPNASSTGSTKVVFARSRIECARFCALASNCLHYGYESPNKTCTLVSDTPTNLVPVADCLFMMDTSPYVGCFFKASAPNDPNSCSFPFQYRRRWYNQCVAVNGTPVPQCVASNEQLVDCLTPLGYSTTQGVNLTVGSPVPLPCISNYIILMQRSSAAVNFYLNWNDYKIGFGNINGTDFWIGNEIMHLITNVPGITYRLRIEVQAYTRGGWFYAEYSTFSLDAESLQYAIHLGSYSGTAGDSLSSGAPLTQWSLNGMKFSTPDADNDMKTTGTGQCSVDNTGSWWFNDCWYCCLTCAYSAQTFSWYHLNDYGIETKGLLRAARMMLTSV